LLPPSALLLLWRWLLLLFSPPPPPELRRRRRRRPPPRFPPWLFCPWSCSLKAPTSHCTGLCAPGCARNYAVDRCQRRSPHPENNADHRASTARHQRRLSHLASCVEGVQGLLFWFQSPLSAARVQAHLGPQPRHSAVVAAFLLLTVHSQHKETPSGRARHLGRRSVACVASSGCVLECASRPGSVYKPSDLALRGVSVDKNTPPWQSVSGLCLHRRQPGP
jgi:hypothetical protein